MIFDTICGSWYIVWVVESEYAITDHFDSIRMMLFTVLILLLVLRLHLSFLICNSHTFSQSDHFVLMFRLMSVFCACKGRIECKHVH